ncbi:Fanconi anemia group G protein isoform X3 [Oryzias latipes]|uniref:Fanconi anemia group G protein isoform X3 n=1 Tax=Oryzias latipes TaxID=8090 RepID=UPI000CE256E5|nr:Fanconi anemia group G protein isoform X3 [Oryzias latipes]
MRPLLDDEHTCHAVHRYDYRGQQRNCSTFLFCVYFRLSRDFADEGNSNNLHLNCFSKMNQQQSLFDYWTEENNELEGQNAVGPHLTSGFQKLLRKIQGVPPETDHAQLELSVVYNACICLISQSQFTEAELLLKQATERILQMKGENLCQSDAPILWITAIRSVENTALHPFLLLLPCLQWAIWLATCQLKPIKDFQESSMFEALSSGVGGDCGEDAKETSTKVPLLVMDPKRFTELLQICRVIVQSAEQMNEGRSSEALPLLQAASKLPAPKTLVAYTHLLSGSCLAHMNCPQMALHCYKKALETDAQCVYALHQSTLVYCELGNTQAEIQALHIMHSTLLLPSPAEPSTAGVQLLSPSLLLGSQSLKDLLSVPSALSVLHRLALKCILSGRVSEGVKHYLDLLATLHSEDHHRVKVHSEFSTLPRLPKLYLEAAVALLMAQRPADSMALCMEVVDSTLELLPETVVIEEPEEGSEAMQKEGEDRIAALLWAAAAYLLQGQCYSQLKDWKQAVTHYTRCVNMLVKVHFKRRDAQTDVSQAGRHLSQTANLHILQRLKGLSLAGRGISFSQMDHLKEALRDLQLSLQALPEGIGAGLWCGEVLWRLDRKREAAARWEATWSLPTQSLTESFPLYAQEPSFGPLLDSTELRHRIQELGPV